MAGEVTMDGTLPARSIDHDRYNDQYLRTILREVKTIAMVGSSPDWNRPSFFAMKYLQENGFRVIPVNPNAEGQEILGEKVYGSLADLPVKVDMVDIFRNSAAAGPLADQAIAMGAKVLWMQLGVRNDEAAARAEAAGLKVVMNRCPKIEHARLSGRLEWHGIAPGFISSKKRKL
jgi:predicted CoA-binding protein